MKEVFFPPSWIQCSLSEIAAINPKNQAEPDLAAGFIPMSHAPITFHGALHFEKKPWGKIQKSYTHFKNKDVIFAKVTPCFENGKAAIVENMPNDIGAGSTEFFVLRPYIEEISSKFLFGIIKTRQFLQEGAENMTGAVGLRRVPKAFVEKFPVVLPPAAEQKLIAAKLDTLLAQVETTKARLERISQDLKRFRQSTLAAAMSGKLTEKWRKNYKFLLSKAAYKESLEEFKIKAKGLSDPVPVDSWLSCQVGQIFNVKSGDGLTAKEMSPGGGIPVYGGNGINGYHDQSNICESTVVIGRVGFYCGSVHLTEEEAWITDNALIVSFPKKLISKKFAYWLLTNTDLRGDTASSAQPVISGAKIYPIGILLPPIEEQTEIVRRLEQLFHLADNIERQVDNALALVNELTQAILAKAFRGELTEQWRRNNPDLISGRNSATALLDQVKAERGTAKPVKRSRKKGG